MFGEREDLPGLNNSLGFLVGKIVKRIDGIKLSWWSWDFKKNDEKKREERYLNVIWISKVEGKREAGI